MKEKGSASRQEKAALRLHRDQGVFLYGLEKHVVPLVGIDGVSLELGQAVSAHGMEFEPGQKFVLGERGKREGQKDEQPKKRFFHDNLLFRIVFIETSGIVKESFSAHAFF
jgi:hypothetical protein